jgi:hypothetical protein
MNIIKQIYTYLLSTITLVITLVGATMFLVNALSLTYYSGYQESYQQFLQNAQSECNGVLTYKASADSVPPYSRFNKEQCQKLAAGETDFAREMYDITVTDNKDMEYRNEFGQMIKSIPWFVVSFPLFLWFNRMRKNEK